MGFNGPWGTTYATNLRKFVAGLDEAAFIAHMKVREFRPPMPTPSIRAMTDRELSALFHYLKSLGDKGDFGPDYLPPGKKPATPYIVFVPVMADTKN